MTHKTCQTYVSYSDVLWDLAGPLEVGKLIGWSLHTYNSTSSDVVMNFSQHRTQSNINAAVEGVQPSKQRSETHG